MDKKENNSTQEPQEDDKNLVANVLNDKTEPTGTTTEPKVEENSQDNSKDKELQKEKKKELELIKARNAKLEEELKGKSTYEPEISEEEKLNKECNKLLESTGFKI